MKSEEQIVAEAYNKAFIKSREKEWKQGDIAYHPSETVIFEIKRIAKGYAIADILDSDTGIVTAVKRFPLNEIVNPNLVSKFVKEMIMLEYLKSANMLS